jgi:UDP-galactopyranose mutase
MPPLDCLIIGAGLTGATIARTFADAGKSVRIIERRDHIAGNCYDCEHPSGLMVGEHGPHYFRTNSDDIWAWVQRFAIFTPWAAEVMSMVDGRLEHWPPTQAWVAANCPELPLLARAIPANFEQACLYKMPVAVYRKFVEGYTEKQWGTDPAKLGAQLALRFDLRPGKDRRLKQHKHQALPLGGYTKWIGKMLSGIPVELETDWLAEPDRIKRWPARRTIYTGAIDEYWGYALGKLRYRAQQRLVLWERHKRGYRWPVPQVNFPAPTTPFIREIEWAHMRFTGREALAEGHLLTREYPREGCAPNLLEYPFPDDVNRALYRAYREKPTDVIFAGRLGSYQYLDMDQAIGHGRALAQKLLLKSV